MDATTRIRKFQCPRCLNRIALPDAESARAETQRKSAAGSASTKKPGVPDHDAVRVAELESDLEILRAENAMLKARVEGLHAENRDLAQTHGLKKGPKKAAGSSRGGSASATAAKGRLERALTDQVRQCRELERRIRESEEQKTAAVERVEQLLATLKESTLLAQRIADLDSRVNAMGVDYVRTVMRLWDVELENARIRRAGVASADAMDRVKRTFDGG